MIIAFFTFIIRSTPRNCETWKFLLSENLCQILHWNSLLETWICHFRTGSCTSCHRDNDIAGSNSLISAVNTIWRSTQILMNLTTQVLVRLLQLRLLLDQRENYSSSCFGEFDADSIFLSARFDYIEGLLDQKNQNKVYNWFQMQIMCRAIVLAKIISWRA